MIILHKEKYTTIELSILYFVLLNSFVSTIIIDLFKNSNTIEVIISIITNMLLGFPLIKLLLKKHTKDYKKNNNKILDLIIKIVLIITSSIIGIYALFNSSKIIKDVLLPNESINTIYVLIIISAFLLSTKGIKSISIATNIFFMIAIPLISIVYLSNLTNIKAINPLPLVTEVKKINFLETIIYTIAPLFLLLIIPKNEIKNTNKYKNAVTNTYIIFNIYLLIKVLFIISILGIKYYSIVKYPEITIFKTINILNFIERIEEILVINIFFTNITLISLVITYINTILKSIVNKKYIEYFIIIIFYLLLTNIKVLNNTALLISNIVFIIINIYTKKKISY